MTLAQIRDLRVGRLATIRPPRLDCQNVELQTRMAEGQTRPSFVEGPQVADTSREGEMADRADFGWAEGPRAEVEEVGVGAVSCDVEGRHGEGHEVSFGMDLLARSKNRQLARGVRVVVVRWAVVCLLGVELGRKVRWRAREHLVIRYDCMEVIENVKVDGIAELPWERQKGS